MTTMRERLERITKLASGRSRLDREVREHAQACIAILDAADWQYDQQRLIPDPAKRRAQ